MSFRIDIHDVLVVLIVFMSLFYFYIYIHYIQVFIYLFIYFLSLTNYLLSLDYLLYLVLIWIFDWYDPAKNIIKVRGIIDSQLIDIVHHAKILILLYIDIRF